MIWNILPEQLLIFHIQVKFPTISTRLSHCSTKILTHQWTDNWLACLHFKTCFTKPLAHVGYTFMNSFCWVTLVFFSFWLINSFKLTVVKYCKFYFFSRKTARGHRDHKFILSNLSIISNEPIINSTTNYASDHSCGVAAPHTRSESRKVCLRACFDTSVWCQAHTTLAPGKLQFIPLVNCWQHSAPFLDNTELWQI